jgi:hypothetical protein
MRPSDANNHRHRPGDGYRCRPCATLERYIAQKNDRLRSLGFRTISYKDFLAQLKDTTDGVNPGRHPAFKERQGRYPDALIAERRAGRGGLAGPGRSRATMAATWRKPAAGWQLRQCRRCEHLLMVSTAPTAKQPEMHDACWREWRRSEEGQLWLSRVKALAQAGRKTAPPIRRRPGKHRSAANLTRNFRWTVLKVLGGETQVALADAFGTDQGTVSDAISTTLALLPDPEVCDKRFRRYVEALRPAAGFAQ